MSRIKIQRYRVCVPEEKGKPEKPIRVVMLGDLHNRRFGEGNHKLTETILQQYPDLVLSVGDLTVAKPGKETDPEIGLALLRRLSCDCPVYCANGNHESRTKEYPETYPGVYAKIRHSLERSGIVLLENESVSLEVNGGKLTLYGYELPLKYYKKRGREFVTAEEIRKELGEPGEESFNILLAHNPIYFESYALWGADLTLSGHLHGGSVRLPFVGGVISPQIKLFPKYDYGLHEKYQRKMIVTSGLGTHSIAFRLNNPPEIVFLELY